MRIVNWTLPTFQLSLLLLGGVILTHSALYAATPRPTPAARKTLGELLQQTSRGGKLEKREKSATPVPTAPAWTGPAGSSVDLRKVKPPRTQSFLQDDNSDQAQLEKITDQQIQEMFQLTRRFRNSPRRGELWLRLAELYVEKAGMLEFRKGNAFDAALKEFQEGKRKNRPRLDLTDARDFNQRAIQLYEWFLRDFPKDERIDQALFFLGYNHFELGNLPKGLAFYKRLTQEYPRSPFVTESHFALGEYYFENEKWADALREYQRVMASPRHRLAGFSTYKAAWCLYRTGKSREGLALLSRLIQRNRNEMAEAEGDRKMVNRNRLESEALRDAVVMYSDVGSADEAVAFFEKLAGDRASVYIEKLAYFYGDKGEREGSRKLFRYLIEKDPSAPKAFEYQYQIVQAWINARQTQEFKSELFRWIRDFGPTSAWHKKNAANQELIDTADQQRERVLRGWILVQHQTAQNSRAAFSRRQALDGYELFFAEFPKSNFTGDMRFLYAELLYDMGRFNEASEQYRWVVENAPNSRYRGQAAENLVIAMERALPTDAEIEKTVGRRTDPVAFAPNVDRFVEIGKWYWERFPTSAKAAEVRFRTGRLFYQHNQFEAATVIFKEVIQKFPQTKYAEYSANLLLDSFNLRKDFAGLETVANELLSLPEISRGAAGRDIRAILERSRFQKAQSSEQNRDFLRSAQQFEEFAKSSSADLKASAYFNAALNYERAGQPGKAMEMHRVVIGQNQWPGSAKVRPESTRLLAKLLQDSGRLNEAASAYEQAAREKGNEKMKSNFLFNAAVLSEALGKKEQALRLYREVLPSLPVKDRWEATWSMAQLEPAGVALRTLEEMWNSMPGDTERRHEVAAMGRKLSSQLNRRADLGTWNQRITQTYNQALRRGKVKGPLAVAFAELRFAEAEQQFAEFRSLRIPTASNQQAAGVQRKLAALNRLTANLLEIAKIDSPEQVVGALDLQGQANLLMAQAILGAPIPKGLSQEQADQYRAEVKKVADPLVEKAKQLFVGTLDSSSDLSTYTAATQRSRESLRRLSPELVKDGGEAAVEVRQGAWVGL